MRRSRKKRDLTNRSLDILNGVNNSSQNNSPRSRLSRPSRRAAHRDIQAPRSDDIWAVPVSQEENSIGNVRLSEPMTPRRSARLRHEKPNGTPLESTREEDEEMNDDDDDNDEIRLFSDDNPPSELTNRSLRSSVSSLTVFQQARGGLDFGENPEIDDVPDTQWTQNEGIDENEVEQTAYGGEPPLVQETPGQSAKITRDEDDVFSSNRVERSARSVRFTDKGKSKEVSTGSGRRVFSNSTPGAKQKIVRSSAREQQDEEWDGPEESSSSDPSDEEDNSGVHESFTHSPDHDESRKSRPNKRHQTEVSHQRFEVQVPRRPDHVKQEVTVISESDSEDREINRREISLFKEAMNVGSQAANWTTLIQTASKMRHGASSEGHFNDIGALIQELQDVFEKFVDKHSSHHPSPKLLHGCDNLFEGILSEGDRVLDKAYRLSIRRGQNLQQNKRAQKLLEGFEAYFVPRMVTLVIVCFKVYFLEQTSHPRSYRPLHRAMSLLLHFCVRIGSLGNRNYVGVRTLSQHITFSLQQLIQALESDKLRSNQSEEQSEAAQPEPAAVEEPEPIHIDLSDDDTAQEWTDEEGHALIEGLQRFHGPNRYINILRYCGHNLRGRTIQQLRIKSRELYDSFVPGIGAELETADRREAWQWLLSVRE